MDHTKQTLWKKEFVNNYSCVSFFSRNESVHSNGMFLVSSATISATHDAASINNFTHL